MKIVIYIESLRTFTSGMPHRGVLLKLIELRSEDQFVLVLRKGSLPDYMQDLFNQLSGFKNWSLVYEKRPRKIVNFLALLHFKNHCKISTEGDVYLSFDAEYLGTGRQPQIITLHDLSSVRSSNSSSIPYIQRRARKFTITNAVNNANKIVAISNFTKEDILDYYGNNSEKITTIHNGIDSKWFEELTVSNNKDNYWVWWGAYSQRKNLERLLKAYDLMLQEIEGEKENIPSLYFVGNHNSYSEKLLSIVEVSSQLKKKVEFFPQKEFEDLKSFVGCSKGLIFPSLYEGFGLPVVEAYSQGVPVLTSKVSSLPEISGEFGVLVDPLDIVSIKNGFLRMYAQEKADPIKLKQYAQQFTYENGAQKYSELIDHVCNSK